jgi:nucleoside phosphorylase
MPNNKLDWYDPSDQSQPVISPHAEIAGYMRKLGKDADIRLNPCFLMSTTGRGDIVDLQNAYCVNEESFLLPAFLGRRPIYTIGGNPAISAVQKVLTSPVAADSLEVAIALGAREIFLFGLCGAIAGDLEVGDIVVPLEIKRQEGTSYHYAPAGQHARPDKTLTEALCTFLSHQGIPFRTGKTVTTDAVYRQTLNKELSWRDEGILGVDMEMSALFTVANFYGLPAVCLLIVSDKHILEPGSKWRWGGEELAAKQVNALNLFVDFIKKRESRI